MKTLGTLVWSLLDALVDDSLDATQRSSCGSRQPKA